MIFLLNNIHSFAKFISLHLTLPCISFAKLWTIFYSVSRKNYNDIFYGWKFHTPKKWCTNLISLNALVCNISDTLFGRLIYDNLFLEYDRSLLENFCPVGRKNVSVSKHVWIFAKIFSNKLVTKNVATSTRYFSNRKKPAYSKSCMSFRINRCCIWAKYTKFSHGMGLISLFAFERNFIIEIIVHKIFSSLST